MLELANVKEVETFKSKALTSKTTSIIKLMESTNKNLYKIASHLCEIHTSKLYEEDGFKSAADYAEIVLGYKRQTTSVLIRTAERFIDKSGNPLITDKTGEKFTIYQMAEMLPLDLPQIKDAIENEELSSDMTKSAIRSKIKDIRVAAGELEVKEEKPKKAKEEVKEESVDNEKVQETKEAKPAPTLQDVGEAMDKATKEALENDELEDDARLAVRSTHHYNKMLVSGEMTREDICTLLQHLYHFADADKCEPGVPVLLETLMMAIDKNSTLV